MLRCVSTLVLAGLALLFATTTVRGQNSEKPITSLKITIYTHDDDKDNTSTVTISVFNDKGKQVHGKKSFGKGENWPEQDVRTITLPLDVPIPVKDAKHFKMIVEKDDLTQGWSYKIRRVEGVTDDDKVIALRTKESDRAFSGHRRTGVFSTEDGPGQHQFDLEEHQ